MEHFASDDTTHMLCMLEWLSAFVCRYLASADPIHMCVYIVHMYHMFVYSRTAEEWAMRRGAQAKVYIYIYIYAYLLYMFTCSHSHIIVYVVVYI